MDSRRRVRRIDSPFSQAPLLWMTILRRWLLAATSRRPASVFTIIVAAPLALTECRIACSSSARFGSVC
ncbi:hypothetical protein [Ralstonia solanacearum]|uniref:hypothetical protein n=1 Tax=Ralstonia solanacearum TaxID=305 RepID=UPI0013C2C8F3|nr:hypothetical protein [Ralstonia solanacearum]